MLILGITFKENCPDVRNTKVVDVVRHLQDYQTEISIYDPLANPEEVKHEYNLDTVQTLPNEKFDAIVLAVAHTEFLSIDLSALKSDNAVVYDVKGVLGDNCDRKL